MQGRAARCHIASRMCAREFRPGWSGDGYSSTSLMTP
jgi:hypothetical protein